MRVLLVEDDAFHAKVIEEGLRKKYPGVVVDRYWTEKEFQEKISEINDHEVIILDQMLPWTTEDDEEFYNPPAPPDGPLRAGSRCYQMLEPDRKQRVIFFTNLPQSAVPPGVRYVRKKDDTELRVLLNEISSVLSKS